MTRSRTLLYAHRGAAVEQPENTLPSFRRAMELGAHALEMDVHLTSDGHVVVSHDPSGERMAGVRGAIAGATLRDVQGWDAGHGWAGPDGGRPFVGRGYRIPAFEEVLAEFPGVPLNVDLKAQGPALAAAFLAIVRRRGDEARVTAASFHRATMKALRRKSYAGATALATSEVLELMAVPLPLWRLLPLRGTAAQLPTRLGRLPVAHRLIVERCRAAGLRVDFWTVNDPDEARRLLALDVDGVMTDDPGRLAPLWR